MFCEYKGLLKVFGTMRLTGDLHQNKSQFFETFSVENDEFFCCFLLRKNDFRDLCVSIWVFLAL